MNTKLFKLLTAGALALLFACSDNVVEYNNSENLVQTKATLSVVVRDNITGLPLKATVKLLTTGAKATADSITGTVSFKDVSVGEHRVLVESENYASSVATATIASATADGNESLFIAKNTTQNVNLYPLTSGLDGFVYYQDTSGLSLPASGVTVRVQVNVADLVDKVFSATSDQNGKFVFSNLPAVATQYTLYLLDWKTYAAKEITLATAQKTLAPDRITHITNSALVRFETGDVNALFELTTSKVIITNTDTLTLTFSGSIDGEKFNPTMVKVINTSSTDLIYANNIEIPTIKIASGNTLKLFPTNGKWSDNIRVDFYELASVTGKTYGAAGGTTGITIAVNTAAVPFTLVNYGTLIKSTDTLNLEFSDEIDATKFNPNGVTVSTNIDVEKIVEGKILRLVPLVTSGKWSGTFTVSINNANYPLVSVSGKTFSGSTRTITVDDYATPFVLVKYSEIAKSTDTLKFEFSDEIDATKFKPATMITFSTTTTAEKIVDGKILKLVPFGGKWTSSSFNVNFINLLAVSGRTLTSNNGYPVVINDLSVPLVVTKYDEIIGNRDTLKIEFSDSIDVTKFRANTVTVSSGNSNDPINGTFDKILANKTLKIVPLGDGKWFSSFGSNAPSFSVSINADLISGSGSKINSGTTIASNVMVSEGLIPFVYVKHDTLINNTDTLKFELSDNIDVAKFQPSWVTFSSDVTTTVERVVDGKVLNLVPLNKWPASFTVTLTTNIVSVNGRTLASVGTKQVKAEQPLTGVKVQGFAQDGTTDWNSTSVNFRWNRVPGATGYRIFAKASAGWNKDNFTMVFQSNNLIPVADSVTANVPLGYASGRIFNCQNYFTNMCSDLGLHGVDSLPFNRGDSVVFFIQAYNSYSETKLLTPGTSATDPLRPTTVKVTDNQGPKWVTVAGGTISKWEQAGNDSVAIWKPSYYIPYIASGSYLDGESVSQPYDYESGSTYSTSANSFRFGRLALTDAAYEYSADFASTINFSEAVDTSQVTIAYEPALARFSVKKSWSADSRTLTLTPTVDAGAFFYGDASFRVQIKNLKDVVGNKFEETYTLAAPTRKKKTEDLEFRFEHVANAKAEFDATP